MKMISIVNPIFETAEIERENGDLECGTTDCSRFSIKQDDGALEYPPAECLRPIKGAPEM